MSPKRATKSPASKPRTRIPPAPRAPMRPVVVPDADEAPAPLKLIFKAEVIKRVGFTYPSLWKWMKRGTFPLSFDVGGKTAWSESEIDAWIASRPRSKFKESV